MELEDRVRSTIRDVENYPKEGIVFKDITPILSDPRLRDDIVDRLVSIYKDKRIDVVAGVEARGFILGAILAHELGCKFVPVRKKGKLPYRTQRQRYDLEYGSAEIEVHVDAVNPGDRVLVHDDLLATGGTAAAAGKLVKALGGEVAGFCFLINLGFLPGERMIREEFGIGPEFVVKY